jgi:hypothetical protein
MAKKQIEKKEKSLERSYKNKRGKTETPAGKNDFDVVRGRNKTYEKTADEYQDQAP